MEKPFTNPLALEWLVKADADYVTANRELRARKMPNYDATCFFGFLDLRGVKNEKWN